MSRLSRQCGIINISQPSRPPQPVTGIPLPPPFFLHTHTHTQGLMWSYDSFAGWKHSQFICHIWWPMVRKLVAHYNNPTWIFKYLTTESISTKQQHDRRAGFEGYSQQQEDVLSSCVKACAIYKTAHIHIKEDSNKEEACREGHVFLQQSVFNGIQK
jgi:hypothetical protein